MIWESVYIKISAAGFQEIIPNKYGQSTVLDRGYTY